MTQFLHNDFAKDCLRQLLKDYGDARAAYPLSSQSREVDMYFIPRGTTAIQNLDLLGRLTQNIFILQNEVRNVG